MTLEQARQIIKEHANGEGNHSDETVKKAAQIILANFGNIHG